MIKAGVVVVTEFVSSGSGKFNGYINYIDRDEATRNEYTDKYNVYQDYMGNPDKTSSLFSMNKDYLSDLEKHEYKNIFSKAQQDGSLMWQTVISFDNRWLEKNGLYDKKTGIVDEKKLKEVTRNGMEQLLKKENLHNAVWTAAIHHNTDNIHIHVATVDPMLERKTKERNGKNEYVGRMKMSSIEAAKSKIVNQIVMQRETNMQINKIIRENIVKAKRESSLINDKEFVRDFLDIYEMLPENKTLWNYNNNVMKEIRPHIDEMSRKYIEKYHEEDMKKLDEVITPIDEVYKEAYGGNHNDFYGGKMNDLYTRLGNAILSEMKRFDKTFNRNLQYKIGKMYLEGIEVDKDIDKALDYLNLSADNGNEYAQYMLGKIYMDGEVVERNINKAMDYFHSAAEQGNQYAQYTLGKLYWYGDESIKQDKNKAMDYMKKSADQGNENAINFINNIQGDVDRKRLSWGKGMFSSLDQSIRQLKKSMREECQHYLNQRQYEQLMKEMDKEQNMEY